MAEDRFKEETITCSDCNKKLMHYSIIDPNGPISRIRASCPFCDGTSFITTIKGKFMHGPIGQEEDSPATVQTDIVLNNSVWEFTLKQRK